MTNPYGESFRAVVVGASGGIGGAFVKALAARPDCAVVHALSRSGRAPEGPGVIPGVIDYDAPGTIEAAAREIGAAGSPSLVVVATGLLQGDGIRPEKSWKHLEADALARSHHVNAVGPALVARAFLPLFPRSGRAVFAALSARVGSIADNRIGGWYGYRSSKAALNQILKCLAIEAARTRPDWIVAGLQPGTVDTRLSQPFRMGLDDGDLFQPDDAAGHLLGVLDRLTPEQSGGLFDWRGEAFPP